MTHPVRASCVVCKVAVTPETGMGFAAGRYVVAVCHEHAPPVQAALAGAREVALTGVRHALQRKAPELFQAGQKAWQLYAQLRSHMEPR